MAGNERTTRRQEKLKAGLLSRLSRVEGQIRGIKGLIEKDAYCDDVLHQLTASRSALDAVARLVFENHVRGCVVRKIGEGDEDIVDELLVTIAKMM